ncbi:ABC-type amino acid transport substrate-binding protein [Bradyrhizobium japonicum]
MLKLTVNSTYAPMEYRDPATNELVGLDIDLANELAKRLGVKIVWSETPFAELIPSLQTRRADFIISGISDRASRREIADFVDYLATGPQFLRDGGQCGQGRDGSLRQEGRHHPQHQLPGRD